MCAGLVNKDDYKKNIKHIKDMFEGKMSVIKKDLDKEMNQAVKLELFEKAIKIRNTMWALDHVRDVSLIKDDSDYNENISIDKNKTFRIEAYDVAHISGTSRVGVMTVVESGIKNTSEYKKFKLIENTNDDYMGIVEMLKRRLKHTEWTYPDLIVIDGGIGQKNIAEKVIATLNLNIRVVSVVKDDRHKARDILGIENITGKKIDINKKENNIQDENLKKSIILANSEAHRFAIKYHKEKRADSFLK
jgi:excinuclease ABC subunit C